MWMTSFALAVIQVGQVGQVQGTVREDSTLIPLANVEIDRPSGRG